MKRNWKNDMLAACDLCGSVDYKSAKIGAGSIHQCHVCRMVRNASTNRGVNVQLPKNRFDGAIRLTTSGTLQSGVCRVLIIGDSADIPLFLNEDNFSITALSGSIESGAFAADSFDVILSFRPIEAFASPATLFAKSRLWLRTEGKLFVRGANWDSVIRRIAPRRWVNHHSNGFNFLSRRHMQEYATRNGFEVGSSRSIVRSSELAPVVFRSNSLLSVVGTLPLMVAATLPQLGTDWWGVLIKRSLASRTILDSATERTEGRTQLATATYSTFQKFPPNNN